MATQQATASAVSVFVHSTGTGPFLWDRIPETVLGGTPKIAPANVGYPPNAPLARGSTTSAKEDAALVLAAIPDTATAVHLYAHSYGGYVALELLSLLGARVASLFLYEPVLFGALAREESADPAALAEAKFFGDNRWFLDDEERGGSEEWLATFIDYWNQPGSFQRMPASMQAYSRLVSWKMFQEVRACFYEASSFDGYQLPAHTTLARGERSPKASRAMVQALAQRHPHVTVAELARTGHMAPLTHPAILAEAMAAHAERADVRSM